MTEAQIKPGCEPLSHAGGPVGVLVLHGFTGSPGTMRPLAEAFVAAGFTVEMPRLPGHGTVIDDMMPTRFEDWAATAEDTLTDLAGRCDEVVVAGLSMGGTLTAWLATRHPDLAGIVCINAFVQPPEQAVFDLVEQMIEAGETVSPGVGSDIADPDATEDAYLGTPLEPAMSMFEAIRDLQPDLGRISCPVLIVTSPQDHVVDPANSDHLAAMVSGPVERVTLERSYHVATLDHDRDLVAERAVDFARKVTGG